MILLYETSIKIVKLLVIMNQLKAFYSRILTKKTSFFVTLCRVMFEKEKTPISRLHADFIAPK